MNSEARAHLERLVEDYRSAAPEGWVRIVSWWAKLGDTPQEASVAAVAAPSEVVLRGPDGSLSQQPVLPDFPWQYVKQMDDALAGEPEAGWLVMRLQLDEGAEPVVTFDHETLVPAETSATSGWADDVHRHLERHRDELEALAARDMPAQPQDRARRRRRWFGSS